MADGFEDLGISPELVAGVGSLGWDEPSGLQRDALPVIRRGNNVVLYASSGAGVVGAYGLGILDQLPGPGPLDEDDEAAHREPAEGDGAGELDEAGIADRSAPPVLVLAPDDASASRVAETLARMGAPAGLTARAPGHGWADRRVDVLVLSPTAAAAAVRDSALKLEGIIALVVDGLDQIQETGQWDELETIVDIIPGSAQRVVVTGRLDPRLEDFIERHVRKAMSIPPRPTAEDTAAGEAIPPVRYRIVTEGAKPAAVVSLLTGVEGVEIAVVCRSRDRAESLEAALEARGVTVGGDDGGPRILVLPAAEADRRSTQADVISADVPFDDDALAALHGRGGAVLATPGERAHLLRIARRAGITLQPLPDAATAATSPAEAVRDRIRGILADADLAADLALVEALLDEYPAAEVAAAALHLARTGQMAGAKGGAIAGTRASARGVEAPPAGQRPGAGAPPPPMATTWTHLFVTVGSRDDVSPGDIVGAMTGEAGISGEQVGKIDIRESHTTVEVATPVAGQVISALNGRTLKGRSLRVDYDRKTRAPRSPSGGRPSGGRGGGRGGGREGGRSGDRGRSGGSGGAGGGSGGAGGGSGGAGGGRPPRRG